MKVFKPLTEDALATFIREQSDLSDYIIDTSNLSVIVGVFKDYLGDLPDNIGKWIFPEYIRTFSPFMGYKGKIPSSIGNWFREDHYIDEFYIFDGYEGNSVPDSIGNWEFNEDGFIQWFNPFARYKGKIPSSIGKWKFTTIGCVSVFAYYEGDDIPDSIGDWDFNNTSSMEKQISDLFYKYKGKIPSSIGKWKFNNYCLSETLFTSGKNIPSSIGNWTFGLTSSTSLWRVFSEFEDPADLPPVSILNWELPDGTTWEHVFAYEDVEMYNRLLTLQSKPVNN